MWHCDFILTEDTGTWGTETTEGRKTEAKRFILALAPAKRPPRNPHERIVVDTPNWQQPLSPVPPAGGRAELRIEERSRLLHPTRKTRDGYGRRPRAIL